MKYLLFIFIFFYPILVNASFSEFIVVTPETEQKYNIQIKVTKADNLPTAFNILIPVFNPNKHSWLIVSKNGLPQKQLNFRNYIWFSKSEGRNIVLMSRLRAKENLLASNKTEGTKYIEIILGEEIIKRSYIYVDFPSIVKDGGYYFMIDLSKYVK